MRISRSLACVRGWRVPGMLSGLLLVLHVQAACDQAMPRQKQFAWAAGAPDVAVDCVEFDGLC
jgi:hypothetical protein